MTSLLEEVMFATGMVVLSVYLQHLTNSLVGALTMFSARRAGVQVRRKSSVALSPYIARRRRIARRNKKSMVVEESFSGSANSSEEDHSILINDDSFTKLSPGESSAEVLKVGEFAALSSSVPSIPSLVYTLSEKMEMSNSFRDLFKGEEGKDAAPTLPRQDPKEMNYCPSAGSRWRINRDRSTENMTSNRSKMYRPSSTRSLDHEETVQPLMLFFGQKNQRKPNVDCSVIRQSSTSRRELPPHRNLRQTSARALLTSRQLPNQLVSQISARDLLAASNVRQESASELHQSLRRRPGLNVRQLSMPSLHVEPSPRNLMHCTSPPTGDSIPRTPRRTDSSSECPNSP